MVIDNKYSLCKYSNIYPIKNSKKFIVLKVYSSIEILKEENNIKNIPIITLKENSKLHYRMSDLQLDNIEKNKKRIELIEYQISYLFKTYFALKMNINGYKSVIFKFQSDYFFISISSYFPFPSTPNIYY